MAAHAENLFVAHIEVQAKVLACGDARVAAATRETSSATIGKSHIVGVVGTAQNRELVSVAEIRSHSTSAIAAITAIAHDGITHPTLIHAFLYAEVDYGFIFAVVNAGEACNVAFAVDNLEFINHISRQVFGCHGRVVGEKFLAVDKKFLHRLTIGSDSTIGAHFHARKALQEVFDHGIHLSFIAVGIIFHSVFLHHYLGFHAHHGGLLQHHRTRLHSYLAKVDFAALRHGYSHILWYIAQIGHFEYIFSGSRGWDNK